MNKKQQTTRSLPQEGKDKDDTGSSLAELAHIEIVSTFSLWIKKRWETIKVPTGKKSHIARGEGVGPMDHCHHQESAVSWARQSEPQFQGHFIPVQPPLLAVFTS